ncbi:MAG: hypothetical protein ACHQVK_03805, partial [Candidatus Paceibacterales bacterium]
MRINKSVIKILQSIAFTSGDILNLQKNLKPAAFRVVREILHLPSTAAELESHFSPDVDAKKLGEKLVYGPPENCFVIVRYKFGVPAKITAQEVVDLFAPLVSDRYSNVEKAQYVLERMDLSLLPKNSKTLQKLFELKALRHVIVKKLGLDVGINYVERGHAANWNVTKPATADAYLNHDIDEFYQYLGAIVDPKNRALFLAYTDFSQFQGLQAEAKEEDRNFWLENWADLLSHLREDEYSIVIEALKNADMPIIISYADFSQMLAFQGTVLLPHIKALITSIPVQVAEISEWIKIFKDCNDKDLIPHIAEKWHFADALNNGNIAENIKQILAHVNGGTLYLLQQYIRVALQSINRVDDVATVLD